VGKVKFLYMFPMSFEEFVLAADAEAFGRLKAFDFEAPFPSVVHERLRSSPKTGVKFYKALQSGRVLKRCLVTPRQRVLGSNGHWLGFCGRPRPRPAPAPSDF
jgi:hypothetical protein